MATLQGGGYHGDGGGNGQGNGQGNGGHDNGQGNGGHDEGQGNGGSSHQDTGSLFGGSHDSSGLGSDVSGFVHDILHSVSDTISSVAQSVDQSLTGDHSSASSSTSSDTTDTSSHAAAVHDTFVFSGGGGQNVVMDVQNSTDLVHIAANVNGLNIQSASDVAAHVTADSQGHAVIDLGHGDSITLHGVSADEVHQNPNAYIHVS